jgi:hypothetical protein
LEQYGDKKWNASNEIHGDLANSTQEITVETPLHLMRSVVDGEMTLNMDFNFVSMEMTAFKKAFSKDVSESLDILPGDVRVVDVLPGSVKVKFQVPTAESMMALERKTVECKSLSYLNKNGAVVQASNVVSMKNTAKVNKTLVHGVNSSMIRKAENILRHMNNASIEDIELVNQVNRVKDDKESKLAAHMLQRVAAKPVARANVTEQKAMLTNSNVSSTRKAFKVEPDVRLERSVPVVPVINTSKPLSGSKSTTLPFEDRSTVSFASPMDRLTHAAVGKLPRKETLNATEAAARAIPTMARGEMAHVSPKTKAVANASSVSSVLT